MRSFHPKLSDQRPLEVLLHHWPAVIRYADEGWARGFALSIQRARKRPGWVPTSRQMAVMQQMVAEFFIQTDGGDEEVVEREKN